MNYSIDNQTSVVYKYESSNREVITANAYSNRTTNQLSISDIILTKYVFYKETTPGSELRYQHIITYSGHTLLNETLTFSDTIPNDISFTMSTANILIYRRNRDGNSTILTPVSSPDLVTNTTYYMTYSTPQTITLLFYSIAPTECIYIGFSAFLPATIPRTEEIPVYNNISNISYDHDTSHFSVMSNPTKVSFGYSAVSVTKTSNVESIPENIFFQYTIKLVNSGNKPTVQLSLQDQILKGSRLCDKNTTEIIPYLPDGSISSEVLKSNCLSVRTGPHTLDESLYVAVNDYDPSFLYDSATETGTLTLANLFIDRLQALDSATTKNNCILITFGVRYISS